MRGGLSQRERQKLKRVRRDLVLAHLWNNEEFLRRHIRDVRSALFQLLHDRCLAVGADLHDLARHIITDNVTAMAVTFDAVGIAERLRRDQSFLLGF